jgi:hypothetical protein
MFMANSLRSVEFALAFACRFGVEIGYWFGGFINRNPNTPPPQLPGWAWKRLAAACLPFVIDSRDGMTSS